MPRHHTTAIAIDARVLPVANAAVVYGLALVALVLVLIITGGAG